MFQPSLFREDRRDVLHAMIHAHPLATLVTHGASGLTANLVPFILASALDGRDVLRAHVATANGQLEDLKRGSEALVIFQGPQAYITPSWYPTKKEHGQAVPTWNYVVVQARGRPVITESEAWLRAQIDALTTAQEQHREAPWTVHDAPATFVESQIKAITGVEIPIDRLEGKWKVSQNQPARNQSGVIAGLRCADAESQIADVIEQNCG